MDKQKHDLWVMRNWGKWDTQKVLSHLTSEYILIQRAHPQWDYAQCLARLITHANQNWHMAIGKNAIQHIKENAYR